MRLANVLTQAASDILSGTLRVTSVHAPEAHGSPSRMQGTPGVASSVQHIEMPEFRSGSEKETARETESIAQQDARGDGLINRDELDSNLNGVNSV